MSECNLKQCGQSFQGALISNTLGIVRKTRRYNNQLWIIRRLQSCK